MAAVGTRGEFAECQRQRPSSWIKLWQLPLQQYQSLRCSQRKRIAKHWQRSIWDWQLRPNLFSARWSAKLAPQSWTMLQVHPESELESSSVLAAKFQGWAHAKCSQTATWPMVLALCRVVSPPQVQGEHHALHRPLVRLHLEHPWPVQSHLRSPFVRNWKQRWVGCRLQSPAQELPNPQSLGNVPQQSYPQGPA